MYKLHAAVQIGVLLNNTPGQVSPLGEFSAITRTYSKDIGVYSKDTYEGVDLLAFSSKQDGTEVQVPNATVNTVLSIAHWLYEQAVAGNLSDNKVDCQNRIETQFSDILTVDDVSEMVTEGNYYLPARLEFTLIENGEVIKLWFSDAAMRTEYELYDIEVIPPVKNLDDLHGSNSAVQAAIANDSTIDRFVSTAQSFADDAPYTKNITVNYTWLSKTDSTVTLNTSWGIVIWGQAGNNADIIRQTIADYILANSTTEKSEWEKVYPDIFRPTEFYLLPMWDRLSLNAVSGLNSVYSPTFPLNGLDTYIDGFQSIDRAHVEEHGLVVATAYKGLAMLVVGNSTNRDDVFNFLEVWPDYVNIATTHVDFNRVSPATQSFIIKMVGMIVEAETYTEETQLPTSMTLVERNGINYVASTYNEILYLVRTKL